MTIASRPFLSSRLLVALAVLALLVAVILAAVLVAGPHLVSFVHAFTHNALAGAHPLGCGSLPGSCN